MSSPLTRGRHSLLVKKSSSQGKSQVHTIFSVLCSVLMRLDFIRHLHSHGATLLRECCGASAFRMTLRLLLQVCVHCPRPILHMTATSGTLPTSKPADFRCHTASIYFSLH